MKIFISYASEDRAAVEPIYYALVRDHTVFFDRSSLPEGEHFDGRIRRAVGGSDLLIYCISPHSVERGGYALTELKFAEQKWPHPEGRVLPLMIRETDYAQIPGYLKAVTVLEAAGNTAAEVVAWIEEAELSPGREPSNERAEPLPASLPAPLDLTLATDDQADQVRITTTPAAGLAGLMKVCLAVRASGWWKGIGLDQRNPTLEGERRDGIKCTTVTPDRIDVAYWKAKGLGVHTHVGTRTLDLRPYGDHEVMFTWTKD